MQEIHEAAELTGRSRMLIELLAEVMGAGTGNRELTFTLEDGRLRRWRVVESGGAKQLDNRPALSPSPEPG